MKELFVRVHLVKDNHGKKEFLIKTIKEAFGSDAEILDYDDIRDLVFENEACIHELQNEGRD